MVAITNLYCAFNGASLKSPILVVMHGWSGDADDFASATLERFVSYGFFVLVPGLRGRNSADGARDASGREIYDIYDAVEHIRATYPGQVSDSLAAIVGYSGGGGNALAAACKFPDYWNCVVDHFGVSDYGRDDPDGWWYQETAGTKAEIEAATGGDPSAAPNAYYARDATVAIHNYSGGHLYMFHDEDDTAVPIVHSQRIGAALLAAGLGNYTENYTSAIDDPRWTHGYPATITDLIQAEDIWAPTILTQDAWMIPASGTVTVIGYIKTKRFEVWLGTTTKGGAGGGLDEVATVQYGVTPNVYTVTPLTGACDVYIEQADGRTGNDTGIVAATDITVS